MGYETDYNLKWSPQGDYQPTARCEHKLTPKATYCATCGVPAVPVVLDERVAAYIKNNKEMNHVFDEHGDTQDACKWYEHEEDMRTMSTLISGVLFTLEGKGKESGDIWTKYFLDGKMQIAKATITVAPFDKKKLK